MATFSTLSTKSAIQTACRGLGINDDIATYISGLVPSERGKVWSFNDCYSGNTEKGRLVITEFKNTIDSYKELGLKETIEGLCDLVVGRSEHACFSEDTLVNVKDKGYVEIKEVQVGDEVFTHNKQYKKVGKVMVNRSEDIYKVKARASLPIIVTGNHPILVRKRTFGKYRKQIFSEPYWCNVENLNEKDHYIGIPINQNSIIPNNEFNLPFENKDFWWIIGRYLGDGWTEHYDRQATRKDGGIRYWSEDRIIICCGKDENKNEKQDISEVLNRLGWSYRIEEKRAIYKIFINDKQIKTDLYNYLQTFGRYAHGKFLNQDALDLPIELAESLLKGYLTADGHNYDEDNTSVKGYGFKSVSKRLILGFSGLVNKIYKIGCSFNVIKGKNEIIQGRVVNSKDKYEARFNTGEVVWRSNFYEDGYIWTQVSSVNKLNESKDMYNLSVYDDNSYTVNNIAVHNCGQLITNTPIYKYNALMKAPNGGRISQFNLGYSEKLGLIKYDILCTSACGNIQLTLNMLVKDGYIEDKGSLRATYESVLLPEKLDRDNPIVWEKLRNGELLNAFQYVGQTGENAIREIGIDSFETAVAGNNVMRLMAQDGGETPLHKYARFKKDITLWYKEMDEHGLNEKEKQQMIELLGSSFGVMSSQEQMMEATIKIVGFDIPQSNIARKAVAKKKEKLLKKAHEMIYEIGFKNGCRKEMLDYLWDVQIAMQRGYGFSQIHGVEYTYILLMELELITKYPAIYWDTALLLNEGGIIQDGEKEKNAKVGKLSKIISILQKHGVDIKGSNINKLNKDFKPNAKDNIINISLKQISGINNDTADLIEQNAPYSSMRDFYERMVVTKREVILSTGKKQMKSLVSNGAFLNLVKAGVFDEVENKTREDLVLEAVKMLNPIKQSFTIKDIDYLLDIGAIPEDYVECVKYYNYRMCVLECDNYKATEIKNGKWYILRDSDVVYEERLVNFFLDNFSSLLTEDKDYRYNSNGEIEVLLGTSRKGSFEKVIKDKIEPLMNYLKTEDCMKYYKEIKTQELIRNNAKGTRDTWYFDSCGFYEKDKHELMSVNNSDYLIDNFNDMPETPIVERFNINKNGKFPQYKLYRIVGTILDYDNNKSSITILDKTGEVINIMFNKGQFNFYKKQISYNDDNGDKIVLEKPWISRGNLVMINGFRREGNYIAKSYANSPLGKHTLKLIEEVYPDGTLKIKSERINLDELD